MKNKIKVILLFDAVQAKILKGEDIIQENDIIAGMCVYKMWLCGTGLWIVKKNWDDRVEKEFFPYNSSSFSTASDVLKILLKNLH